MTYRPGELDELIDFQREERAPDGGGGSTVTMTTFASGVWAHARPRSGKEMGNNDQVQASAMYLFVVRYRDDITEGDRIAWNGDTYNIRSILTRGPRSLYIEIDAERGVPQ